MTKQLETKCCLQFQLMQCSSFTIFRFFRSRSAIFGKYHRLYSPKRKWYFKMFNNYLASRIVFISLSEWKITRVNENDFNKKKSTTYHYQYSHKKCVHINHIKGEIRTPECFFFRYITIWIMYTLNYPRAA